ncbi:MAG TPA: hypothetical protein PLN38_17665 [Chitinophagales bacterium]|nr:hypothetical protein [Chitinophagales bacterium]
MTDEEIIEYAINQMEQIYPNWRTVVQKNPSKINGIFGKCLPDGLLYSDIERILDIAERSLNEALRMRNK